MNYLTNLPEELSVMIYHFYLQNVIKSNEFNKKRNKIIKLRLQKTLSMKQRAQLGI